MNVWTTVAEFQGTSHHLHKMFRSALTVKRAMMFQQTASCWTCRMQLVGRTMWCARDVW